MSKIKSRLILLCIFALVFCILQSCSAKRNTEFPRVKVIVTVPEGVVIESANPVYVDPGGTVEFALKLNDGFKLAGIDTVGSAINADVSDINARYENGILRYENIFYPATLRLNVRPLETYKYLIEYDARIGMVSSDVRQGKVIEDTNITVSADVSDDYIFLGWSKDAPLEKGGVLLSYSPEYNFDLISDMTLYPNYISQNGKYIKYNANGGTLTNSNTDELYYEINTDHYPCPNVFGDTGVFAREGYALLEYNTAPDGSGESIGLGGNIATGEENIVELFVQWEKYSEASLFTYTESGGKITITGYDGHEEMIVVPEVIDGKPVTAIKSGAFKDKDFKTLFLTKNLTSVAAGAITNCPNLETIYLSDSLSSISDESISDCPNFANLRVNAIIAPRYTTNLGWNSSIKYKWFITSPGKRLILIAGSSMAFGMNSPMLSELLDNEYSVVNFGSSAQGGSLIYIEFVANQIREGDLVIIAPEARDQQQGGNLFSALSWQLIEGYYDVFRYIDIRNYTNVLSAFTDYNSTRRNMIPCTYEDYRADVNIHGDMLTNIANRPESWVASPNAISFQNTYMTSERAARLNRLYEIITARGGRLYMSFPPANKNALTAGSQTEAVQTSYMNNIRNLIQFPLISKVSDYIYPGNYFSDTDYHLSTVGAIERTIQLASDIKAQFEIDAQK